MPDWDVYRYLLAIRRHGGLSGAARALGVTHATVSRQLDRAEAQLGAKLFDRFPSGLTPTPAGAAAVARAEAIEAQLHALDLELTPETEGPLAITMPPLMLRTHLAGDLTEFAAANPRISLSVLSDNRFFDLHRREADLAIRVTHEPAQSLWGRKLTVQRRGYFATPDFIDRHARALAVDDPSAPEPVPVIAFTAWKAPLPKELKALLPGARVAAVCDDMVAALALASAGLGLVRAPIFVGVREPALRWIATLPLSDYAPIWVLTHPDLRRTPKVREAMRFLADRFTRAAPFYLDPTASPPRERPPEREKRPPEHEKGGPEGPPFDV